MIETNVLNEMARIKAEIQYFQLWVDNARTNKIAKIRYGKVKDKLKGLVVQHKNLTKKWLEKSQNEGGKHNETRDKKSR